MTSDLLVCLSGLDPATVLGAIPPSCRGPAVPPPPPVIDGEQFLLTLPEWTPRRPARHLLPSLSVLTPGAFAFRFELAAWAGQWTPWVGTVDVGPTALPPLPAVAGPLEARVDVVLASRPVERIRLRLRGRAVDPSRLLSAPWLVALSASDLEEDGPVPSQATPVALDVPPLSQMEQAEALRHRICSPTSVAMVLQAHGVACDPTTLAAEVFHPGLDLYGVWPAAIQAAARLGVPGYLLRFPGWGAAEWCLARGLPLIASLRYAARELTGAAVRDTAGHLVVLRGRDADRVLVNDPAAPDRATVARRYPLDEFTRVWLERTGVGYVLFPRG